MNYIETVKDNRSKRNEAKVKQGAIEAFTGLSAEIRGLLKSLEKTGAKTLDQDFVTAVEKLSKLVEALDSVKVTSDSEIKQALYALGEVLANLDVRPVVNVASPKVELKERDIDLKPLADKLDSLKPVESLDYKAQDMDDGETNQDIQYLGAVNAKGGWYIIENSTLLNTLRFKFGKKDYVKGWEGRAKHSYKLYNEALNEA